MTRALSTAVPSTGTRFYETTDLDFAAYLVAAQLLALDHIEPRQRFSVLCFADPERRGQRLFTEYNTKDLQVSARLLLETRAGLLNAVRGVRG